MKGLDYTVLTLIIIGAINWGLVGFFGVDLVAVICGSMSILSRIIYAVIGICGLYAISFCGLTTKWCALTYELIHASPDHPAPVL